MLGLNDQIRMGSGDGFLDSRSGRLSQNRKEKCPKMQEFQQRIANKYIGNTLTIQVHYEQFS